MSCAHLSGQCGLIRPSSSECPLSRRATRTSSPSRVNTRKSCRRSKRLRHASGSMPASSDRHHLKNSPIPISVARPQRGRCGRLPYRGKVTVCSRSLEPQRRRFGFRTGNRIEPCNDHIGPPGVLRQLNHGSATSPRAFRQLGLGINRIDTRDGT